MYTLISKLVIIPFCFLIFIQPKLSACGWFYTLDSQGRKNEKEHEGELHFYRSFSKESTLEQLKEIEVSLAKDYNFEKHSDYAMLLSRIGKVKEALEILKTLNEEHPGEYILMANLGTLYELNGKNQKALEWIQKAMDKNPNSHYGSEWIHVKILEAKLNIAKDSKWLDNNPVLDIDYKLLDKKPLDKTTLDTLSILESHIGYQLHERIPYTLSPDPIVFQLLMDLGRLASLDDLYNAHLVYHFALLFTDSTNEKSKIQDKITKLESLINIYRGEKRQTDEYKLDGGVLNLSDYQVIDFFSTEPIVLDELPLPTKNIAQNEQTNKKYTTNSSSYLWLLGALVLFVFFLVLRFRSKN